MTRPLLPLCLFALLPFIGRAEPAPDATFIQEVAEHYPFGDAAANDARAIALDATGSAWIATAAGVLQLDPGSRTWTSRHKETHDGPAFTVVADPRGIVWIGAWDGVHQTHNSAALKKIEGIEAPISVIAPAPDGAAFAFGPRGAWRIDADGTPQPLSLNIAGAVRAAAVSGQTLWAATSFDLYRYAPLTPGAAGLKEILRIPADEHTPALAAIALAPDGMLWTGGMGGVGGYLDGERAVLLGPGALPNSDVRALAVGSDGRLWIASALGVARREATGAVSLRHGRRWLLSDDVHAVTLAPDGAAWIATAAGVSVIRPTPMTLEKKASLFLDACHERHIRPPGLVEKCALPTPGDISRWEPRDDDNDGQYTAMYLAMESYRYASTGNPEARERARAAFGALETLRTITGDSGFVARTVIPPDWTRMSDPNEEIDDKKWAFIQVEEPRAKRVETHWRLSDDKRWRWKTDTSSDEITGHFYGYLMFHDLAADAADRKRVAEQVRAVMDHIIEGGYTLRDVDGQPTRWGVWAPEKLNGDPLWAPERGINSVEILSFLKTAHHITGEERYRREYLRLAREEGYAENTRRAKTTHPSVRTHIDDELLALAWPGLFLPDDDADLIAIYREGFNVWREANKMEQSPFFNFTFAAFGPGSDPTLEDSLFFLRDAPMDLIRWTMDNSTREDLALARLPEFEHIQTNRLPPPSERGVMRWDDNPWKTIQGDGGRTESDGVYWLLPYWMGRYYGYIAPGRSSN